jgi:hypothetical protein
VAFSREHIRDSIERAGDEHWEALVRHHTDVYPESNPTPGDVCRAEAERRNGLGFCDNPTLEMIEGPVERAPPRFASPTFSKLAAKAPGSRPNPFLATNERGPSLVDEDAASGPQR